MKKIILFIIMFKSLSIMTSEPSNNSLRRVNSHVRIEVPIQRQPQELVTNNDNNKCNCSFTKIALTVICLATLTTVSYTIWRQENINSKINTLQNSIPTNIVPTNISITLPVTFPKLPTVTLIDNPTLPLPSTIQEPSVTLGNLSTDLGSLSGILNVSGSSSNSLLP